MNIKRTIAAGIAATGLGLILLPGLAEAHNSSASSNCTDGLRVRVSDFPPGDGLTTVTIDGRLVDTVADNFLRFYNLGSPFETHTWVVHVEQLSGTEFDRTYSKTEPPCQTPTTPPPTTAPPTTAPPTTAPPTTAPPTTAPPTTAPGATTTTTTVAAAGVTTTTTGTVGGQSGTVPAAATPNQVGGVAGQVPARVLPATGSSTDFTAGVGAALLVSGGVLWFAARRTRRAD